MKILSVIPPSILAAVSLGLCSSVHAEDYLPLGVGNQWYYTDEFSNSDHKTIVGEEIVHGVLTRVCTEVVEGSQAQVLQNFWTRSASGDLFLHGARNFTYALYFYLDPPILMADAPLYLGKTWVTPGVIAYDSLGVPIGVIGDYALAVYSEGDIDVPAGTFYAFGVGAPYPLSQLQPFQGELAFDLLGRAVRANSAPPPGEPTDWVADGVGPVQWYWEPFLPEGFMKLEWWEAPVPTRDRSWGEVKTLYR